jgi:hypothetical protein
MELQELQLEVVMELEEVLKCLGGVALSTWLHYLGELMFRQT